MELTKRKDRFKRLKIERTSWFIGGKIIPSSYFSQSYSFSQPRSKPIRRCSAVLFSLPPDLDLRAAADLVLVLVLVLPSHSETESDSVSLSLSNMTSSGSVTRLTLASVLPCSVTLKRSKMAWQIYGYFINNTRGSVRRKLRKERSVTTLMMSLVCPVAENTKTIDNSCIVFFIVVYTPVFIINHNATVMHIV